MKHILTLLFIILALTLDADAAAAAPHQPYLTTPKPEASTPRRGRQAKAARHPQELSTQTFTANGVSFNMCYVKGGTFRMGATAEQGTQADDDEKPVHKVTLGDYYIGQTEVTQALWKAVMGSNPSYFPGDSLPVERVSWNDCQTFIEKLNQITGRNFRLPTEAQWEFAARGGNNSRGYMYSGSDSIDSVAWYGTDRTHEVATKQPNELGIYDMSGNVWEWCSDWYGDYTSAAQTNPRGVPSGSCRVDHGGGWFNEAKECRVSVRNNYVPPFAYYTLGLRLALMP